MRKSKKWGIVKGGIFVGGMISILMFMHTTITQGIAEDDIVVDDMNICYVDDEPYYREPEAIVMPPLVYLDKLSDEDKEEEIFLSYPEHYPHTEYFDGPDVAEESLKDDPRNPIGKWVGRGLLSQPQYWWHSNKVNPYNECKVKTPRRVDEPSTLWLIGMFPLLYLFRRINYKD